MRYAIGLDIGGTMIRGAVVNDRGSILYLISVPTQADKSKKKVLANILFVVNALKAWARKRKIKIVGIGAGSPGFMMKNNKMTSIHNIPCFMNFNLKKALGKLLKHKIIFENDTNCFALGEYNFGAGKKSKNMVGIILGTGVGAGLVFDGKLYVGNTGAGECGHSFSSLKDKEYHDYCSGSDLAKKYKKSAKYIFSGKDKKFRKAVKEFYSNLGLMLSQIVNLLDNDLFVIGGGVAKSVNVSRLKKETDKYAYPAFRKRFKIKKQKLKYPGVLGAAALVFQ